MVPSTCFVFVENPLNDEIPCWIPFFPVLLPSTELRRYSRFRTFISCFPRQKKKEEKEKEKKSLHFSSPPPRGYDTIFFSVISEEEKKTVSQQQLRSSGHREREKTKLIFFLRVGNQCVRVANYHAPPLRFPSIFRTCVSSLDPLFLPPSDSRKRGRISVLCLVS